MTEPNEDRLAALRARRPAVRRQHQAAGGRLLATGLSVAAMVSIVTALDHEAHASAVSGPSTSEPTPISPTTPALTTPAPSTPAPTVPAARVPAATVPGGARTITAPRPAGSSTTRRPVVINPAPKAAQPVTRSHASR